MYRTQRGATRQVIIVVPRHYARRDVPYPIFLPPCRKVDNRARKGIPLWLRLIVFAVRVSRGIRERRNTRERDTPVLCELGNVVYAAIMSRNPYERDDVGDTGRYRELFSICVDYMISTIND